MMSIRARVILCGVLLALVAAAPGRDLPLKPPKHGGVYVVAHRGAHIVRDSARGIPENTIPAYKKAIELGVDFVEIDVRTTKDGKFVSMHNDTVDAYAGGAKGKVRDYTLEAIRALDVGSRVGPEWKGAQVPTFEEILDLCKGRCGIYLDLKDAAIGPLVDLIKARGMEHDVLWYAGPSQVKELRRLCPECVEMPDPGPEKNLPRLIEEVKPRVIASTWKWLSKAFVDTCHAAGAIVIVDESDPSCWQQAVEWGTDGIQTDHPEDLIKFLASREVSPSTGVGVAK